MAYALVLRSHFPKAEIMALNSRCGFRRVLEQSTDIGAHSGKAGFYTREDFLRLCKLTMSSKLCATNTSPQIERETRVALHPSTSERRRITALMRLSGVSWSAASAILHFTLENQYPILGTRALWSFGFDAKPAMNFDLWWTYVEACRALCSEQNVKMSILYCALWQFAAEQRATRASWSWVTRSAF
jgi:hypothetical protein